MSENSLKGKQKRIENYYDQYVSRQKRVGVNKRHYSIIEKLQSSGLKPNHDVLEIGCGIGTFTSLLADSIPEGNILAMDISGESISHAQKTIKRSNLNFVHADSTNYDFRETQFDVVILPDVLEHIPIELHDQLFSKISKILNQDGFIFIHIPNPYYLRWCHKNRPDLLQVVDQPITADILVENIYPHGLFIQEMKSYSIWVEDNDYQYIIVKKDGYQDFSNVIEYKPSFLDKVKYKLNAWRK